MNILMKSRSSPIVGRIRLIAMIFSNPSTPYDLALNTSAMPPTLMRSRSKYFPKGTGCLTPKEIVSASTPDHNAERGQQTTAKRRHSSLCSLVQWTQSHGLEPPIRSESQVHTDDCS